MVPLDLLVCLFFKRNKQILQIFTAAHLGRQLLHGPENATKKWLVHATNKSRPRCPYFALSEANSDDHQAAIEGWKNRKDQLHKQRQSVSEINDEADKVNLLSLSKQKSEK